MTQPIDHVVYEYKLSGIRGDYSARLCLGLARADEFNISLNAKTILSVQELELFEQFRFEGRRKEFLLGRWAAKRALCDLFSTKDARSWSILPNVHGAPVTICSDSTGLAAHVSISHNKKGAIAVACPSFWPAAIDLEQTDERNLGVLTDHCSTAELLFIQSFPRSQELAILTMLWSIKESLAKLLESGLTAQMTVYETTDWELNAGSVLSAKFVNFSHVQARALNLDGQVLAMTYPFPSRIDAAEATFFRKELGKLTKNLA